MTLEELLARVLLFVALPALIAGLSLAVLTTLLHRSAVELRSTTEQSRAAAQLESRVLLHARSTDPASRGDLRAEIRDLETQVVDHGRRGDAQLDELSAALVEYLRGDGPDAATNGARVERVMSAVEQVVGSTTEAAHQAAERARRWNQVADVLALGSIGLLVAGMVTGFLRMRRDLAAPLSRLAGHIAHYGRGARASRASEDGPAEVRAIAHSFNDVADALEEQRQLQLAVLGGVAHDLRNPLTALRNALRLMNDEAAGESNARVRALATRQVDRLDRMVGDLLDAARAEAGQLELELDPHDVRELAKHVVDLYATASPAHAVRLVMSDQRAVVRCDPLRLEQVLGNLVGNAIKYSPRGGEVLVSVERDAADVIVAVKDHGLGIAPELRSELFEPFRRGQRAARGVPGAGLGLFVSRRIVEAHGGSIDVDSAVGVGSTFCVRLPGIERHHQDATAPARAPSASRTSLASS